MGELLTVEQMNDRFITSLKETKNRLVWVMDGARLVGSLGEDGIVRFDLNQVRDALVERSDVANLMLLDPTLTADGVMTLLGPRPIRDIDRPPPPSFSPRAPETRLGAILGSLRSTGAMAEVVHNTTTTAA